MKILIYFYESNLAPSGGPAGYLYNLSKNLNADYHFLQNNSAANQTKGFKYKAKQFIKKKLPSCLKIKLLDRMWRKKCMKIISDKVESIPNLNEYDAIHFHDTFRLYKCRDILKNYKGKVILTSHCPKAPHLEVIQDNISKKEYKKNIKIYDKLSDADVYAFERADYIIFPCKEAEEPYLNTWLWYKENSSKLDCKKRYLLTGTLPKTIKLPANIIRENNKIPENAFVISYVGRHLSVKGYDVLVELYERLKENSNIYFLICGKINSKIEYPKAKNWIEIGWTNSPMDYVNASDVFILPNKETYFDLVLLETMSIGKPSIVSYTGGNKYVANHSNGAIKTYKTIDELVELVNTYSQYSKKEFDEISKNIFHLYESHFNVKIFAENYMKTIDDIIRK